MATPVILSLHSSIGIIKDKRDIAAYLIRQYFSNPGKTSELFENELISFNKTKVLFNSDPTKIAEDAQMSLNSVFRKYFQYDDINVEVKAVNIVNTSRYNIEVRAYITDNKTKELYLIDSLISNNDGVLTISFGQNYV